MTGRTRALAWAVALLLTGLVLAPTAGAAGPLDTRRALEREMRKAGSYSGAMAIDLDTGQRLYASREAVARVPASVNKLHLTAALLRRLGPDARLATEVLAAGAPAAGVVPGNLYLRGGGDPDFGPREASKLAGALKRSGVASVHGRVIGDESLFDSRRGPPSSGFGVSYWVGPLSALSYARGLTSGRSPHFQARPSLYAARQFERALRRRGIRVRRAARAGVAPRSAVALLEMPSATMAALAARTNVPSDNFRAETLIKLLGARFAGAGTTAAGARVVSEALDELGVSPRVVDGSGLSRGNRASPSQVVTLLRRMAATGDGAALEGSLAVAGRSGTLSTRMRGTAADGRCRAKTGTLSGVSALAGYCTTTAGARVAFAFLMNGVDAGTARRLQDRMTARLASYRPRLTTLR